MSEYHFNPSAAIEQITDWTRKWFEENGKDCNAIVGISGGKDSTITATLLCRALGRERVIGVTMPNSKNTMTEDLLCSESVIDFLGIKSYNVPIGEMNSGAFLALSNAGIIPSMQTRINLPARLRMSMLYAVAQSMDGRVANTCNLSEDYVGYSTRYGDSVGDFGLLSNFTVTEVRAIGRKLRLPSDMIYKTPSDGLCGMTDEDRLGFLYEQLDAYIRKYELPDTKPLTKEQIEKIEYLHNKNAFKLKLMDTFCPDEKVLKLSA